MGEWTTGTIGHAQTTGDDRGTNRLRILKETRFPHSLGLLYSAFTAFLGFEVNEGEYKVMGMAPYGEPRYLEKIDRVLRVNDDASFWLDMSYFSYHYSPDRTFSQKFVDLFGEPRDPRADFVIHLTDPGVQADGKAIRRNQYYADLAASIQRATEDLILRIARQARRPVPRTPRRRPRGGFRGAGSAGRKGRGMVPGRFEWGPRALGNRSILADPRRADMKGIVNSKIKFREPFRPFAPAILEERAADFFTFDAVNQYPARFMLLVLPFKEDKAGLVSAVNHMGTGRLARHHLAAAQCRVSLVAHPCPHAPAAAAVVQHDRSLHCQGAGIAPVDVSTGTNHRSGAWFAHPVS